MHTDLRLGELITSQQRRDCVHIAVAPVVAQDTMKPGQQSSANGRDHGQLVGIVDPFLNHPVNPGDAFWLFLYPGTVNGMRHHWSHSAFPDDSPPVPGNMSESEMWLRVYAKNVKPYEGAEEAYQNLLKDLRSGELYYHGRDLHSRGDVIDEDDLLEHGRNVLGHPIGLHSFSCSC